MFNSREYQWSDLSVLIGTNDITGIRSVKYEKTKEKELMYGKGAEPIAIQSGNVAYNGEIALLQSEFEALKTVGGGSILDLQTTIVVNYGNPDEGSVMKTDILVGVQFTSEPRELKQGDKMMEITLPILFLRIK